MDAYFYFACYHASGRLVVGVLLPLHQAERSNKKTAKNFRFLRFGRFFGRVLKRLFRLSRLLVGVSLRCFRHLF